MDQIEADYDVLKKKLKMMLGRLSEVEAMLGPESDDDSAEDDEVKENDNVGEELKNLIAESEERRYNWERSKGLLPETISLGNYSLEENGLS